jgi:hypothetical protein
MSNVTNLVVGIGGSGAKSVEALVHLCACGLGPRTLTVAVIDPDKANGNVDRARRAVDAYQAARKGLQRSNDESKLAGTCSFLKTDISKTDSDEGDRFAWSPVPPETPDLRSLFEYPAMPTDAQRLMDALYQEKEEQQMGLAEGFRGRPSVGAAVLAALRHEPETFWPSLIKAVDTAKQVQEVRVFLVGSIFGGTGASGFPVIARMLRQYLDAQELSHVRLSGAMLQPYFSYAPPPPIGQENEFVSADPRLFVAKAQQSLLYYQSLMDDAVFDDLYIVGWPRIIPLPGDPHHGGKDQCNPPLLPEFYAGLAAADVFTQPVTTEKTEQGEGGGRRRSGILHIGLANDGQLTWEDLPDVGTNGARLGDETLSTKQALANGLRFAFAYSRVYATYLADGGDRRVKRYPFWKNYLKDIPLRSDVEQGANRSVLAYCETVLRYLLTITDARHSAGIRVELFDRIGLVDEELADGLVQLRRDTPDQILERFPKLVTACHGPDLADILHGLSERSRSGDTDGSGLGRFISALYAECAPSAG